MAPALRVLTYPLLALTVMALGRGWYLQLTHGGEMVWQRRARIVLALSTIASITLWVLRFAGVLGMSPL
ncbi:MAG: hypothetical protein O7F09_01960 [Chloroflexi bacterium]|nr:hypothetical protein [Chloroflexota bacterium]